MWVRWVGFALAPIFVLGGIVAVVAVVLPMARKAQGYTLFPCERQQFTFVFAATFLTGSLAMCALHCCENDRFFMSFAPWSLVFGILGLQVLLRGECSALGVSLRRGWINASAQACKGEV